MTLLADVNHPGSQEDVVSNWESAHSLVEVPSLWQKLQKPLAFGSGCHRPAFLPLSPSSDYTRQLIILGFCFLLSLYFSSFHGQYPPICSHPTLPDPNQVSTPPGPVPTRTSLTSLPPKCVIPPFLNTTEDLLICIIRMWAPGTDSCLFITVSSCGVKNRIGG